MKNKNKLGRAVAWVFAFVLGGWVIGVCAQEPAAPVAPPVPEAVPAQPADSADSADAASKLVTLDVPKAPIVEILRGLAAMRKAQITITPDVTGDVSVFIKDAKWEDALRLIAESNGFQVTNVGENAYQVSKMSAPGKADIVIEMLNRSDVAQLSDEDLLRMAATLRPGVSVSPAMAREELLKAPHKFVKQIQVEGKPAIDVVSLLAKKAGLNFTSSVAELAVAAPGAPAAAAPAAGQPVSLSLRNLSVEDAMKLVASQGGLQCVLQSGVWALKPMLAPGAAMDPLKTETFTVQFLPVDDDLLKGIQKFLTERGKISYNKNKITIRDTADSIESVRSSLAVMDTPTPQVVIEARLFQITETASRELGFKRSDGTVGSFNLGNTGVSGGIGKTHARGASPAINPGTAFPYSLPVGNNTSNAYGGVVGAVLDLSAFSATLQALNQMDGVRALSNPKITVSSDQQATINIARERPIIKQTVQTSTGGTPIVTFELDGDFGGESVQEEQLLPSGVKATTTTKSYTTRKGYLSIGTKLAVMPSVKTEDQIYVKVVPELTSQDGADTDFGTGVYKVSYPNLKSTRVKTEFTIRSGQTIAIGGLVDDQMITSKQSMPGLGSIPWVGSFFSYSKTEKTKVETLIFLTVTMVPTEKLHTTVGLPIRSTSIVDDVDRIKKEDQEGAGYDQERTRKEVKSAEAAKAEAERPWWKKAPRKAVEEVPAATPAPDAK